jgi:hypothetical protein
MGTRSRIGVMQGNECKSVYCHWDGYLSHNGAILQEHYDSEKINHLVSLGDLSTLCPEIGEKHPFSQYNVPEADRVNYDNWCTFYGRDRDETDTDFKVTNTFAEFLELVDNCGAEYFYIMKDGVWYCGSMYAVDGMIPNTLYVLQELLANEIA